MKPYSYVLVENKADTSVHRQIISDVFGSCVSFALPGTSKPQTLKTKQKCGPVECLQNEIFISIHALEKYLDVRNVRPSAFFDQHMIYENTGKCLSQCGIMIVRSMF